MQLSIHTEASIQYFADWGSANLVLGSCLYICKELQVKYINVLLYLCNFSSLENSNPFTLILQTNII